MSFSDKSLTRAQRRVLGALSGVEGFFLSGGAALSAGYLHHRLSEDLDLFCPTTDDLEVVSTAVVSTATSAGLRVTERRRAPGFRRYEVRDDAEATLVDVVHEPVVQIVAPADKPVAAGVRYDALDDLVANKLCATLGRSEVKDLVDLHALAGVGIDLLAHLADAGRKDAGMDPATLAWVLAQLPVSVDRLHLLRPVAAPELERFRDRLVEQLQRVAWPEAP